MTRLEKLLKLANSTRFKGERENAIAAAQREASKSCREKGHEETSYCGFGAHVSFEPFNCFALYDRCIQLDKSRRDLSLRKAMELGLDSRKIRRSKVTYKRKSTAQFIQEIIGRSKRRDPVSHAEVLLKETMMDLGEISSITGLDVKDLEEMHN